MSEKIGCVQIDWWRKPSFKERRAKLIEAITAEGYIVNNYDGGGLISENSEWYNTILEVRRPRFLLPKKLFEFRMWNPEDALLGHKIIPYTMDVCGGKWEEAKKLADILCIKLGESISLH